MHAKKLLALIVLSILGCGDSNISGTPDASGFEQPLDAAATEIPDGAIVDAPRDVALATETAVPADLALLETATRGDSCELRTGLTFFAQQGVMVPGSPASYTESYHLDNTGLLITRNWWNGYDADFERRCRPQLPVCGLPDQITVANIGADLADPDVAAALAAPPYTTFGAVKWPSDAWSIADDVAAGRILVGLPCNDADAGPCQPIPIGLERLKNDLQALAAAGVAQAECTNLLKP